MKALPEKFQARTVTARCDPTVRYTIVPINNRVRMYIDGYSIEVGIARNEMGEPLIDVRGNSVLDSRYNPATEAYGTVAFSLADLHGIEGLVLDFDHIKMSDEVYKRVKDSILDRIPFNLFLEILVACRQSIELSQEEQSEVNFTPASSTEGMNAPETSETVPADAAP